MGDFTSEELIEEYYRRIKEGGWYKKFFNSPNTRAEYPKHWAFFDAGSKYTQRLFRAGNRTGKSLSCGTELVMHLTGDYHPDWRGKRFDGAVDSWVVGKSSELVRQSLQPLLLGPVGSFGTGLIPLDRLDFDTLKDAKKSDTGISSFRVLHKTGGWSTVTFKSDQQGREAFQATALDIVWLDEEVSHPVYIECFARLMTKEGILMYSFTPLKGLTDTVISFSKNGNFDDGDVGDGKYVEICGWDDVPHLTEDAKRQLLAAIPPFQRDARSKGVPQLGAGAIYPVAESDFVVEPFEIPKHWKKCYGMDVGSKTAAVWLAIDPETQMVFAWQEYYKEREEPSIHTAGIKTRGDWIKGAIDPASRGRSQIDGQALMDMYKELGLHLSPAVNAVEAGLYTVWELLSTDRLKIFKTCTYLLNEFRTYRRDEKGHVVKTNDHLCDALRYAIMTRDIATVSAPVKQVPLKSTPSPNIRRF